jgi:PTS system galactitol-specific IIB component
MAGNDVKYIVVACPAGINTSTIGVAALEDMIRERKLGKQVKVIKSNLSGLDRWAERASVIIEMTPLRRSFEVPVVSGVPFISGMKAQKRKLAEEILEMLDLGESQD